MTSESPTISVSAWERATSAAQAASRSVSLRRRWATFSMVVGEEAKAATAETVGTRSGQRPMSTRTPLSLDGVIRMPSKFTLYVRAHLAEDVHDGPVALKRVRGKPLDEHRAGAHGSGGQEVAGVGPVTFHAVVGGLVAGGTDAEPDLARGHALDRPPGDFLPR